MVGLTVESDGTLESNNDLLHQVESIISNDHDPGGGNSPDNHITFRKRKSCGVLPLEVGTRVMCRWRDTKFHPVKVIEHWRMPCGGPNDYEYYVQYIEFNRRLDEWVKLEQLDIDTMETDVDEKVEDKGHEELDAASLCELEEFATLKNIATRELGRYEIKT